MTRRRPLRAIMAAYPIRRSAVLPPRYARATLLVLTIWLGSCVSTAALRALASLPPALGAMSAATAAAGALGLWSWWQRDVWRSALSRGRQSFGVTCSATVCCTALSVASTYWWTPTAPRSIQGDERLHWPSIAVVALVLAPLLEETLMRGILLQKLRRDFGNGTSVFVSSALFAVTHDGGSPLPVAFIVGALLGAIHLRTGRLWLCVWTHAMLNLGSALPWLSQRNGLDTRFGVVLPICCLAAAALALRRILLGTRWLVPPRRASLVAPPVTWEPKGAR
jgi:membrane protease YdiL (CAAX protease family)